MMKKILSVVLAAVLFAGLLTTPVLATENQTEEKQFLFLDLAKDDLFLMNYFYIVDYYDELYYHYDKNGDIDWALVYNDDGHYLFSGPDEYGYMGNGSRFVYDNLMIEEKHNGGQCYFVLIPAGYQYVTEYGTYFRYLKPLGAVWDDPQYENIKEIFYSHAKNDDRTKMCWVGDITYDGKLTIEDATETQKCLAGISQFKFKKNSYGHFFYFGFDDRNCFGKPNDNLGGGLFDIGDANRDNTHDIGDVTQIQRWLAELDEY